MPEKIGNTNNLRACWIVPFLNAVPWILAHPNSKRLPKGMNFGRNRRGGTSIEVFCREWRALTGEYIGLCTDADFRVVDTVFDLLNKYESEVR